MPRWVDQTEAFLVSPEILRCTCHQIQKEAEASKEVLRAQKTVWTLCQRKRNMCQRTKHDALGQKVSTRKLSLGPPAIYG